MKLNITVYSALVGVFCVYGCMFRDYRKEFEVPKDAVIGKAIDQTVYRQPHWMRRMATGRIEYGYKDFRGCSWAIEIDESTRVILIWRYLSEPQLCWSRFPTA